MFRKSHNRGFTLIEAMLLLVIVGIVALAAGVGLQSVAKNPSKSNDVLQDSARSVDLMERLRATDLTSTTALAALDTKIRATLSTITTAAITNGTAYTGSMTVNSSTYPAVVSINTVDINGDGTVDADIVKVQTTVGSQSLMTYITKP